MSMLMENLKKSKKKIKKGKMNEWTVWGPQQSSPIGE